MKTNCKLSENNIFSRGRCIAKKRVVCNKLKKREEKLFVAIEEKENLGNRFAYLARNYLKSNLQLLF